MNRKKILIVEDDKVLSEMMKNFVGELGYDLIGIYEKGRDAIAKCDEQIPDIIIMDIHLPGEYDGIKTASAIHEKYDIPVIYLSADTDENTVKRAIATNSYGYLIKPVDEVTLGITIEQAYYKHKSDREIRIREKRYSNLINNSPNAVIIIAEGIIEYINYEGLKLFGTIHIEDLLEVPMQSLIQENYIKDFEKWIDKALKEEDQQPLNIVFKSLPEKIYNICVAGSTVEFKDKKALQLIVNDYTERIEINKMLEEQDNIIDNIYDGVFSLGLGGKVKSWNKGAERMYGVSKKDILGQHISDIYRERDEMSIQKEILEPTLEKEKHELEIEFVNRSNKEKKWTHLTLSLLKNELDELTGIVCYSKDITLRKISEEHLRVSQANLKAIFDGSKEAIFFIDNEHRVLDSNKLAREYIRKFVGSEVSPGKPVLDIISFFKKEEFVSLFNNALQGVTHYLERVYRFGDDQKYFQLTIYPIMYEQGEDVTRFCVSMLDITERKTTERDLQDSQSELKPLFDSSIQRFYLTDLNCRLVTYNKAAIEIIKKEFNHNLKKGDSFLDFVPQEIGQHNFEEKFEQAKNGEHVIYKHHGVINNADYWAEIHLEPILNDKGEIVRVLIWTLDITNEKIAEDKLKESQQKYFTLFTHASDAILIIEDNDRVLVDCNEKAEEIFGYTRDELLGLDQLLLSPDTQPDGALSAEKRKDVIDEARNGNKLTVEWKYKRKDGNLFDAEVSVAVVNIRAKEYLHVIIRDITRRKEIAESLKESERRNLSFLEAIPDLLFVIDKDGNYLEYRDNNKQMVAVDPDKIIGMNIKDIFEDDKLQEMSDKIKLALETGKTQTAEYTLSSPVGQRWMEARITHLNETQVLSFVRDVTDRVEMEDRLKEANIKLEEQVEIKNKELKEEKDKHK